MPSRGGRPDVEPHLPTPAHILQVQKREAPIGPEPSWLRPTDAERERNTIIGPALACGQETRRNECTGLSATAY